MSGRVALGETKFFLEGVIRSQDIINPLGECCA